MSDGFCDCTRPSYIGDICLRCRLINRGSGVAEAAIAYANRHGVEKFIVDEAPETPIDDAALCLSSCGTQHRGCDPQCPRRWYGHGTEEGYSLAFRRIDRFMEEEPSP